MAELKAVLWDHDGTLVDTEPYWIEAQDELSRKFGATWTHEDSLSCVGTPMTESASRMKKGGVEMEVDDIIEHLVDRVAVMMDERGIPWLPGVQDIFAEMAEQSIPAAIVSNAYRKVVGKSVAGLPDGVVKVFIAGDDMVHAKPHPWPYEHAADLLGVPIENCVVVEDSLAGTLSGEAAGAPVLVVPSMLPVPEHEGRSFAESLEGITLDTLREIADGHVLPTSTSR